MRENLDRSYHGFLSGTASYSTQETAKNPWPRYLDKHISLSHDQSITRSLFKSIKSLFRAEQSRGMELLAGIEYNNGWHAGRQDMVAQLPRRHLSVPSWCTHTTMIDE